MHCPRGLQLDRAVPPPLSLCLFVHPTPSLCNPALQSRAGEGLGTHLHATVPLLSLHRASCIVHHAPRLQYHDAQHQGHCTDYSRTVHARAAKSMPACIHSSIHPCIHASSHPYRVEKGGDIVVASLHVPFVQDGHEVNSSRHRSCRICMIQWGGVGCWSSVCVSYSVHLQCARK